MNDMLEHIIQGRSVGLEDAPRLFQALTGDSPPEVKAAILTALRAKGESETEILGLAREMRRAAVPLPDDLRDALDTCGTGGDGLRTINLSTLAAILLSSMGVPIVKHGNRSVSSSCGSADVLEGLGMPIDLTADQSARLFRQTRFAFLFAPLYHPAMKSVAPVRRALKIRTIFNFLGPLSNPAQVRFQILGVPADERVRPFADVLKGLGVRSAAVVHGDPGMDEISPCGLTRAAVFTDGGPVRDASWTPESFGVQPAVLDRLTVSGIAESVERARLIMAGRGSLDESSAIVVNAAVGLWIAGRADDVAAAAREAAGHLASGRVADHWHSIIKAATGLKSGNA